MDFEQEFEVIPVTRVKIADTEAYSKHPFRVVHMDLFFHTITRSKTEENNGKHSGWLIGGRCAGNDRLKMKPIRQYRKSIEGEYIEYVGIAADEPKRLERLTDNKRSLLYEYHCTEEMAYGQPRVSYTC